MDIWESKKERIGKYRQRAPEGTALYRIVASCYEDLERCWDELFQPSYGVLRDEVRTSFERYLECGILAHGCARAECQNGECRHSELIAYSCKRRCVCPSCDAKRAVLFAENVVEHVLKPLPHQHVVFTIPKRIRPFFKFNRSLNRHLYAAAWSTWQEQALEHYPNARAGAVLALHSAGDLLPFHPHIHGLFLAGVVLPDGSYEPVVIDPKRLEALFADKVRLALFSEQLLTHDDVLNMQSWPHSGFNAFVGEPIDPGDTKRLLFAARYLKKCPVSNERLAIVEKNGEVIIEYAAYKDGVKQTRTFSPLEFLAELQQHIPKMWEQTSRYLGVYSSRTRGTKTTRYDAPTSLEVLPLPEPRVKPSASWARCMKKIFELDPLLCPKCGSAMKIKAFITDSREIDRLMTNLCLPPQRAPPRFRYSLPVAA